MIVRLTQLDGKLPNLALMHLAQHWRQRGAQLAFSRRPERDMIEPEYDHVYGSAIFSYSAAAVSEFKQSFPNAVVGGTWNLADRTTVEDTVGAWTGYDYSIYPAFDASIGFTQRGCRLKCGFCVVPNKEGKPRTVATVADIWRGDPYPRHLHLLDNDFFGQPREQWEARIAEIKADRF